MYGETSNPEVTSYLQVMRVYPRVYGETHLRSPRDGQLSPGLSPRVRGNLVGSGRIYAPTLAPVYPRVYGETSWCIEPPSMRCLPVYPRVYGETTLLLGGLSPRVRGNLRVYGETIQKSSPCELSPRYGRMTPLQVPGSIPACTGKPPTPLTMPAKDRSIPACTGKPAPCVRVYDARSAKGLSPRVRGNPAPMPC